MAFYEEREIGVEVPCIKARYDNVLWNEAEADRLKLSEKKEDKKLGKVMASGLKKDGHRVSTKYLSCLGLVIPIM